MSRLFDFSWRFDAWFESLPPSPADLGRVDGCVLRTGPGLRATPARVRLVEGRGVEGDAWPTHPHSLPENQVALINVHVLRSVADGDPQRMALSGDNLHVDLDLSEANLPAGSILEIGEAALRVTALLHRPCSKFVERFGVVAAKRVARALRVGRRGRGVLCEVVRGGIVTVGDAIRVTRPRT
jgi:MOSC domain-containing protein YiiM